MDGGGQPEGLVLVVEDAPGQHAALVRALAGREHRVIACQGAEALDRLQAEEPDVVLVDRAGAIAVLDASPVPVIVLAGSSGAEERAAMLAAGAAACLPDPLDPVELEGYIQVALRFRRLERLSLTDPVTGLGNRRHGEHELAQLVVRSSRHGHPLGLVLVDVDGFKSINDTHGHDAGDRALREVAERMAACLRGSDTLCRWGGEEFVVLLPDTEAAGVGLTAERLRHAVAADPFRVGGAAIELTVSVGWADWRGEDPGEYVLRADRALYEAKTAGRNAVRPEPAPSA
jgi:two-component system cell cycle response regulator